MQPETLDLSHYVDDKLVDRVLDMFGTPAQVMDLLKCVFWFAFLVPIAAFLYLKATGVVGIWSWVALVYAGLAGLFLGTIAAALWFARSIVAKSLALATLTAERSRLAVSDMRKVESGTMVVPSSGQLVVQMYEQVILPTLEHVIGEKFTYLKTPVLFLYRNSIGRIIRFALARLVVGVTSEERKGELATEVMDEMNAQQSMLAGLEEDVIRIEDFLRKADASFFNRAVLAPFVILFGVLAGLIVLPILIVGWAV